MGPLLSCDETALLLTPGMTRDHDATAVMVRYLAVRTFRTPTARVRGVFRRGPPNPRVPPPRDDRIWVTAAFGQGWRPGRIG